MDRRADEIFAGKTKHQASKHKPNQPLNHTTQRQNTLTQIHTYTCSSVVTIGVCFSLKWKTGVEGVYTLPSIKPETSLGEPQGLTVGHQADSLAQLCDCTNIATLRGRWIQGKLLKFAVQVSVELPSDTLPTRHHTPPCFECLRGCFQGANKSEDDENSKWGVGKKKKGLRGKQLTVKEDSCG